jgi:hypothetical protein
LRNNFLTTRAFALPDMRDSVATSGLCVTLVLGLLALPIPRPLRGAEPLPHGAVLNTAEASPKAGWRAGPFEERGLLPAGYQLPVLRSFHLPHTDPDDPGRHIGLGEPLEGTSWLNRPYHVGWLWGSISSDWLVAERVKQHRGMFGGYRIGWDFDHYWGTEARFAFSYMNVSDNLGNSLGTSEDYCGDVHLLYYPWGDARWRPFLTAGVGFASFRFDDDLGQFVNETVWGFPVGGGLKYLHRKWLAVRVSVMDNLALGAYELRTQHNLSITGGVEVRFGGPRRSYFPYNPSRHLW